MKKSILCVLLALLQLCAVAQNIDSEQPDKIAEFPGGTNAMLTFLSSNLTLPDDCQREGVSGRVMISFTVERDGSLSNITPIQSPDERLSDEAVRVVKLMPKWNPALLKEKPVKMSFTLPISFVLSEPSTTSDRESFIKDLRKELAGKTEAPCGLYKMIQQTNASGTDVTALMKELYKICKPSGSIHVAISKALENDFHIMLVQTDVQPIAYTGNSPVVEGDTLACRIYDCGSKGFILDWFPAQLKNMKDVPLDQIEALRQSELWSSEYEINPKVRKIVSLLEKQDGASGKKKLTGCWYQLGAYVDIEGTEVLMEAPQKMYKIYDTDAYLSYFDLSSAGDTRAYCILRPCIYPSNDTVIENGVPGSIKWMDDNTFKYIYKDKNGAAVTELYKRSCYPKDFQQLFGIDVPTIGKIQNPIPRHFR